MNILAIDTTTKIASVALQKENVIDTKTIDNEITHSEKLLPLIDAILKKNNITINEIDEFACINGPGSFTGIRIGISTIKAFCHAKSKKVFVMSTLETLAIKTYIEKGIFDTESEAYIATFIDAKNNRCYFELFKISLNDNKILLNSMIETQNMLINDALTYIHSYFNEYVTDSTKIIFTGDIITQNEDNILNNFNDLNKNILFHNTYPKASDLNLIRDNLYDTERYRCDCYNLNAKYARPSQAERISNGK